MSLWKNRGNLPWYNWFLTNLDETKQRYQGFNELHRTHQFSGKGSKSHEHSTDPLQTAKVL